MLFVSIDINFVLLSSILSVFVGSKGSENELQIVLEEITKIDPNFTTEKFIRYCRLEVIPNVLEVSCESSAILISLDCPEKPFL